jgi:hypothetical protein
MSVLAFESIHPDRRREVLFKPKASMGRTGRTWDRLQLNAVATIRLILAMHRTVSSESSFVLAYAKLNPRPQIHQILHLGGR